MEYRKSPWEGISRFSFGPSSIGSSFEWEAVIYHGGTCLFCSCKAFEYYSVSKSGGRGSVRSLWNTGVGL